MKRKASSEGLLRGWADVLQSRIKACAIKGQLLGQQYCPRPMPCRKSVSIFLSVLCGLSQKDSWQQQHAAKRSTGPCTLLLCFLRRAWCQVGGGSECRGKSTKHDARHAGAKTRFCLSEYGDLSQNIKPSTVDAVQRHCIERFSGFSEAEDP